MAWRGLGAQEEEEEVLWHLPQRNKGDRCLQISMNGESDKHQSREWPPMACHWAALEIFDILFTNKMLPAAPRNNSSGDRDFKRFIDDRILTHGTVYQECRASPD